MLSTSPWDPGTIIAVCDTPTAKFDIARLLRTTETHAAIRYFGTTHANLKLISVVTFHRYAQAHRTYVQATTAERLNRTSNNRRTLTGDISTDDLRST